MSIEDLLNVLKIAGISGGWILFFVALYMAFKKPELFDIIASKILRLFRFLGAGIKKKSIERNVRGVVLKATKAVSKGCEIISPYDVKIEFVSEKDKETFISDNQIIVRMSDTKNSQRNLIWALNECVKKGVIPQARVYVPQRLLTASDLLMLKKLVISTDQSALSLYFEEIVKIFKGDRRINLLFEDLNKVDHKGFYTRIFLHELEKMSIKYLGEYPSEGIKNEIKDFASFLIDIATKQPGERRNTVFHRGHIRISLILASSGFTKEVFENTISTIIGLFDRGSETIYILALGCKVQFAKAIAKRIEDYCDYVTYTKTDEFVFKPDQSARRLSAVCIQVNIHPDSQFTVEA